MLLGDFIADFTKKLGVPSCIPCQGRQDRLNQMHLDMKGKAEDFLKKFSSGQSDSSS